MSRLLEVTDLSFSYPTKDVFSQVSFSMSQGEMLCLMGPNGCGKTTLLDNIIGMHKPTSGEILLTGKSTGHFKKREIAQKIAYVPQVHQVIFPYTVEQIVLMGRTAYVGQFAEPGKEDREYCRQVMELVGISDFAKQPYNQLSGGETKLVLLARALSQQTPLVVMDEPTANLDYKNELIFLETIVKLNKRDNISILMATHSPEHVFYFQGKGLHVNGMMMSNGKMVAQGLPEKVITEKNIEKVYGVKAHIRSDVAEDGTPIQSITLLGTV